MLFLRVTSEVSRQGKMLKWNINKTCRVCLTQDDNMKSLYDNREPNEICKKLEYCTFKIIWKENLPLNICVPCFNNLETAYNFKQKCATSLSILQNVHKNKIINNCNKTVENLVKSRLSTVDQSIERKFITQTNTKQCLNNNKSVSVHRSEPKYLCNICGYLCTSLSTLTSHLIKHSDKLPYSCHLCEKKFKSRASKSFHLKSHSGERKHYCNKCGKRYFNSSGLKYHMRSHHRSEQLIEKLFTCKECDKGFKCDKDLKIHVILHTGEFPFICDTCGRGFNRSNNYKMHMRRHSGIKTHICDTCGFALFTSSALKIHKRSHTSEKPYSCKFCNGQFATSGGLNRHKKRLHLF